MCKPSSAQVDEEEGQGLLSRRGGPSTDAWGCCPRGRTLQSPLATGATAFTHRHPLRPAWAELQDRDIGDARPPQWDMDRHPAVDRAVQSSSRSKQG